MSLKDILADILAPFRGGKSAHTAAELRRRLDVLPSLIADAEKNIDALEQERQELLITGTDEQLAAIDARQAEAARRIEQMRVAQKRLQPRLAEVEANDREADRQALYARAKRARVQALKDLRTYPALAAQIADLLTKLAKAEALVNEANAQLPDGAIPLQSIEQEARGLPGEAEEILDVEIMEPVWCHAAPHESRGEVSPRLVDRIESADGKSGHLWEGEREKRKWPVERRATKRKVTFRPARARFAPVPLWHEIFLPGFEPGQGPLWVQCGANQPGVWADEVVREAAAFAENAKAPASDPRLPRDVQTRIEPLPVEGCE